MYSEETKGCDFVLTLNEGYTNSSRLTNVNERLILVVVSLDETRLAVEREGFERLVLSIRLHEVIFVVETILREAAHSFSGVLIHSDGRTILLNTVGTYLLSDSQRIAFVVDIPTGSRAVLVYTGNTLLTEVEELELRELVRVDRVVSRSDDTGSFTGSLVLESSGGNHLIIVDILGSPLDIQDELKETVFNRSLLHRNHSSAIRSAVSAIDGEVSEVSSSRIDLSICGVEVVNRLSVTAGGLGSSSLRGVHLVVYNTVHELVHRPSVVGELVAFDGFDTAIVAIGDEFETNEEVVFEEVQTPINLVDLPLEGTHLSLDESLNFFRRGTFSEFFIYVFKIDLCLSKRFLQIFSDLFGSGFVFRNTLFERSDLIQGVDLRLAEEVLRLNSLKAFFKVVKDIFLRIDTFAKQLISLNEFAHLRIERSLELSYVTLSNLNLAEDVSNRVVEILLIDLIVDKLLQLNFRIFEQLHSLFERYDVGESVLKLSSLTLNRCVGCIEVRLLSVVTEFAFDLTNLLISCIEIRLLGVVSEFAFDLSRLLVGRFELSLQGGDLSIQVVLDRHEISLVSIDLLANGSKIIIVVLAGHERACGGCHNEQTEQCAVNDFLVH